MKKSVIFLILFLAFLPGVFAQESEGFLSGAPDLIGTVLAVIVVLITLATLPSLSGNLRKNWIYLTIAMIFFAISGLSVGLDDFTSIPYLELIGDIAELIFIIVILFFVYNLRNLFKNINSKKV